MKTQPLTLIDFGSAPDPEPNPIETISEPGLSGAEVEAIRTEAYEGGYKSGWDDAVKSAEAERKAISEELARNLRDIGFTYFEAREEILGGLRAFLEDLLDTLFPTLLSETLCAGVAEELADLAEPLMAGELSILVSPDDAEAVRTLLPLQGISDLEIVEEAALPPGLAHLKTATREVNIDAERIVSRLREALAAPAMQEEEERAHG